jgi:hypothetical protein
VAVTWGVTNRFLARSGPVWSPSDDGTQLVSPRLASGQASEFSTFVSGPFNIAFQWSSDLGVSDEVVFYVDGTEIGRLGGTSAWSTISYSESSSGMHQLRWRLQKRETSSANSGLAWMRNLSLAQQ